MLKRTLIISGIIIAAILLGTAILLYLFAKAMCGDDLIGKYLSPDTKHQAVYYVRDCGATTGFVDHVELDGSTVLMSEAKDGGHPALSVKWVNNSDLSISVATSSTDIRVYRKPIDTYKSIDILFDPKIMRGYANYIRGSNF